MPFRITLILLAAVLVGCQKSAYQPPPPSVAHNMRTAALARAKEQGKLVFLWFAIADSDWCLLMDRFLADPDVVEIYDQHFIPLKIDLYETPGGEQLYLEHGSIRGVPAFSLLDADGNILSDSGSLDEPSNIGFPTTPEQLDAYEKALQTARPQLKEEELAALRASLQEVLRIHNGGQKKAAAPDNE